ncbi:MAG: HupE/UreJ family protein [Acidobacteria bacterium]|nr:HupE/UreJ family protein [Acidobacteriota bacterium]
MRARPCAALGVWLLLLFPGLVSAHPSPFSYLDLRIGDTAIQGELVVHVLDVANDLGISPAEQLLDQEFLRTRVGLVAGLLEPRFSLRTTQPLPLEFLTVEAIPDQQAIRLRFRAETPRPAALALDTNLFPYDPLHQTFVNVYEGETLRQQMIFNAESPERRYFAGTAQGMLAVVQTFVPSGVQHILIGPDHILFLIGLLLLGGSWWALLRIVTAFTIGHSITLSLAALDLVSPPATLVEPAIALSIVFVGADNLVRGAGRDLRAWAALVFGLVHGFGFAYVLREFGLPREALGWSLFSFNLGVEIGQVAIVLVVASVLALIRARSEVAGRRVAVAGSLVVIAAGAYWFVQRAFGVGL